MFLETTHLAASGPQTPPLVLLSAACEVLGQIKLFVNGSKLFSGIPPPPSLFPVRAALLFIVDVFVFNRSGGKTVCSGYLALSLSSFLPPFVADASRQKWVYERFISIVC